MSLCRLAARRTIYYGASSRAKGIDLLQLESKQNEEDVQHVDLLYGIHPIQCAIEAGRRTLRKVMYRRDLVEHNARVKKILEHCWSAGIDTKDLHKSELDGIVPRGRPHQGILAVASRLYYHSIPCTQRSVEQIQNERKDLDKQVWLMLCGIQDPMNLGSILRSAYFLGCDQVFVSSQNSCPLSPVVSKASSGAMEFLPVHSVNNVPEFCRILREMNWDVVGTEPKNRRDDDADGSDGGRGGGGSGIPLSSFQLEKSSLIILGNEGRGLRQMMPHPEDLFTRSVYIPSRRDLSLSVDSLNVSAAAAVLLHSMMLSRYKQNKM